MSELLGHDGKMAYVYALRLYAHPNGDLIASLGNVKCKVSDDEAAKLLEFLLLFAKRFRQGEVQDGSIFAEGVFVGQHATSGD